MTMRNALCKMNSETETSIFIHSMLTLQYDTPISSMLLLYST